MAMGGVYCGHQLQQPLAHHSLGDVTAGVYCLH